jgi:hypothetical protein
MRKVQAAAALGAVALLAASAATGAAAKGPLKVHGKAAVFATPINTLNSKGKNVTTSLTVTGKVKTQSTCASGRKIEFIIIDPRGSVQQSTTATTTRNGSFSVTLPFDTTGLTAKQNGTTETISATATQVTRRDKDTGDKVKCLEASGINDFTAAVG